MHALPHSIQVPQHPLDAMDLNRLRSKRLRLFDSKGKHHPKAPSSAASSSSSSAKPSISDDEKFARELQAQIEAEERPAHSKAAAANVNEDAKLARELQMQMDAEADLSGDLDASFQNAYEHVNDKLAHDAHFLPGLGSNFTQPPPGTSSEISPHVGQTYVDMSVPQPSQPSAVADPLFSGRRKKGTGPMTPTSRGPVTAETPMLDTSQDAADVRNYATALSKIACRKCPNAHILTRDTLIEFFSGLISGVGLSLTTELFLICPSCSSKICIGCSETLPAVVLLNHGTTASNGRSFTWHCDATRLAVVWCLLCGFDNDAKHNKQIVHAAPRSKFSKIHTLASTVGKYGNSASMSKGVGYGIDNGHDGYSDEEFAHEGVSSFNGAGVTLDGRVVTPPKKTEVKRAADADDELMTAVMAVLVAILPAPFATAPTMFDVQPHPVLRSMFLRSSLLDKVAELLRNDSLDDAITRRILYDGLLTFIRTMAQGNYLTSAILHEERPVNKAGHDLCKVSFNLRTLLRVDHTDMAAPIADVIRNLTSQSNMVMRNCVANPHLFESGDGQQLLELCTSIVECNDLIQTVTPRCSGKAKVKEPEADQDAWQKELAVMEIPDEDILAVHFSAKSASECKNIKPGRMRQLVKEVTNLQTSLPPGIFVRYGESRLDVMKVLIVGPKGTPYQNGLFEFDLFCPDDYPNVPPKMQLKTTGGGRHRFNPNLYQDGKVCLSLLNTWSGQRWTPGQSTILQVLVSIQAMVFCDEPHCNEPGYENQAGSDLSKQYNRNQYAAVVKYAMLEWLDGERKVTPTPTRVSYEYGTAEPKAAVNTMKASMEIAPSPPVQPNMHTPKSYSDPLPDGFTHYPTSYPATYAASYPAFYPAPNSVTPAPSTNSQPFPNAPPTLISLPTDPPPPYSWTPMSQPPSFLPPPTPYQAQCPTSLPYNEITAANPYSPSFTNPWATGPKLQKVPPQNEAPPAAAYKPTSPTMPTTGPAVPFTPYHPPPLPRPRAPAPGLVDKSSIWDPVVKQHFEVKHEEILETVCSWVNDREPLKNLHRSSRGKGRRLGTDPEAATTKASFSKAEELKNKGQDLKSQLREALKELPERKGGHLYGWDGF